MKTYLLRLPRTARPIVAGSIALLSIVLLSACGKKAPIAPPPPPPPAAQTPAAPTGQQRPVIADFSIEPSSIERGQSAVLRWNVTGATDVAINNGLGTVTAMGLSASLRRTRRRIP